MIISKNATKAVMGILLQCNKADSTYNIRETVPIHELKTVLGMV
jgi:hypothetical protein